MLKFVNDFHINHSDFIHNHNWFIRLKADLKQICMLVLNLKPIFRARSIKNPFNYLVKAGISRHCATKLLDNSFKNINLDHIEIMCKVLTCEPNDLLTWIPNKHEFLPSTHPLHNLKATNEIGITEVISNIPYKELKTITKTIMDNTNTEKTD